MSPEQGKDKVLEIAKLHLQLGTLLKKKRNPWGRREVEKVLTRDISDKQKISSILKIDKAIIEQENILKKKKPSSIKKDKKHLYKPLPLKKLKRENMLFYMLFQYKKIASFGIETSTLKAHPLTFGFKVDNNVGTSLYLVNSLIKELLEPLYYVIESCWKILSKEQYNIIITFYNFCNQYYKCFLKGFDYTDIIVLEGPFLTIIQKGRYKQMLIDGVIDSLEGSDIYNSRLEYYIASIKKIIEPNNMLPSLTHILLALHMIDLRQFINIRDLIYTENPPAIKKNRYLAPGNIARDIQNHIIRETQGIIELEEEIRFAELANKLFFDKEIDKPRFSILIDFLHEGVSTVNLDKEKEDLLKFILRLLKEYVNVFKSFTLDKVIITTKEDNIVEEKVTPYAMDSNFHSIILDYRQLVELGGKGYDKLSFDRYKAYIEGKAELSYNETNFFIVLRRLSKTFYEISLGLFNSYFYEQELDSLPSYEKMVLAKNKDLFEKSIPYSSGKVNLNYYLSNKTVVEVYLILIEFCLSFSFFFLNQDLVKKLKYLPVLKDDLYKLSQLILRIG